MINEEAMRLWVQALRSGEYIQGNGHLAHYQNGQLRHCCLGVACRVAIANGIPVATEEQYYAATDMQKILFDGHDAFLPSAVTQWLGVQDVYDDNVMLTDHDSSFGRKISASEANDVYHWDFARIADTIERDYLQELEAQ